MPRGTWIYDQTTPTGGGEPGPPFVPPDAPPVKIIDAEKEEQYGGKFEVRINWEPADTATSDNFKAVAVYLEDPDLSSLPNAPLDGTVKLDGSTQLSGKWNPVRITDTSQSPATLLIDGKPADRDIRVYLEAYNQVANATPVRANKPGATPSIKITIPAEAGKYVSGQEYAWFITNPRVDLLTDYEAPGGPVFWMNYGFDPPDPTIPLPPGLKEFGGVQIVFRYPSQGNRMAPENQLLVNDPITNWRSGTYPAQTITFDVLFCSMDVDRNYNTPIFGLTPWREVTVTYDTSGAATPDLTAFKITTMPFVWQPDGTIFAEALFEWTPPDSVRWSQVGFWVMDRPGHTPYELQDMRSGGKVVARVAQIIDWPKLAPENWTIAAISFDANGKMSDDPAHLQAHTPRAVWHLTPATTGDAPFVTAPAAGLGAIVFEQQLNSDGVVMMRQIISGWTNPNGNKFGGVSIARIVHLDDPLTGKITWWDAPLNATSLTTDWEPAPSTTDFDYYFVSRDPQGNRNQLLPGVTPAILAKHFDPIKGDVLASRLPKDWFNEDEFSWPAGAGGLFTVDSIVAPKIFVGSILRVGGGTAGNAPQFGGFQNGQIVVYNNAAPTNEMRAWMGQQSTGTPDQPGAHAVYGGWFKELYVGGDNPTNAPIYANSAGVVVVGGFDSGGPKFPYISIRDETNTEKGRIGARIGQGLVPVNDPAFIAGAWFNEFAVGGTNLSDWRILARRDTGGVTDLVNFRNINKFQIDYAANYNPGGLYPNPTNAAMTLLFGYDAFVADSSNPAYRKFPGLSITRYQTGHQAVLINRGLVLNMPTGSPPYSPVRAGAFVTYNGDQNGGDAGVFWTVLTMNSQVSGNVNVELGSGSSGNGASYFRMYDAGTTLNFGVDQAGNVTIRGTLSLTNLTLTGDMTAKQYFITGPTQVITIGGQFNGPGGINTTGSGSFGSFVRSNDSYYLESNKIIDKHVSGSPEIGGLGNIIFIGAVQFGCFYQGGWTYGADGQFNAQDGRVIKVRGGIITAIG